VRALNSHVDVAAILQRLTADNAEALLPGHDLIIDGCDNFATRLIVSDTLTRLRIPLVSAAAVQFQGQVALFRGWEADKPCYRCFVGDAFDTDDCDTCAEQGVLGALAATVGSFASLMAIRAIVGIGEDVAGSLFLFNGTSLDWRKIRLPKDPNCRTCSV
jgi:molybdopterin-synthase adenylyltransferase